MLSRSQGKEYKMQDLSLPRKGLSFRPFGGFTLVYPPIEAKIANPRKQGYSALIGARITSTESRKTGIARPIQEWQARFRMANRRSGTAGEKRRKRLRRHSVVKGEQWHNIICETAIRTGRDILTVMCFISFRKRTPKRGKKRTKAISDFSDG